MTAAAHARYRTRLAALSDDEALDRVTARSSRARSSDQRSSRRTTDTVSGSRRRTAPLSASVRSACSGGRGAIGFTGVVAGDAGLQRVRGVVGDKPATREGAKAFRLGGPWFSAEPVFPAVGTRYPLKA
mgnify:CR=1 FL=1